MFKYSLKKGLWSSDSREKVDVFWSWFEIENGERDSEVGLDSCHQKGKKKTVSV